MGLISKIEDKLSGSSSSDQNKLEKSNYGSVGSNTTGGTSSTTSKIQNPISSGDRSGPTGSAIDPSTGNVHSSYAQDTSRSGVPSNYPQNTSGYTSSSGAPSSYPQNTSGYTSTSGATDRMPGSYVNDETHIPSSTTSTSRTGPNQPYDPYSSRGQETAARAGTTSSTSRTMEDPSMSRSRDGGIMNEQSDPRYTSQTDPRYTSQTSPTSGTTSSHHYGRDAALGAGALGAGGAGAYEMNRDKPPTQPLTSSTGHHGQTGQYQDDSYTQQSQPRGAHDPSMAGMQQSQYGGSQDPSMSRIQQSQYGGAQDSLMSGAGPGITTAGSHMPGSPTTGGNASAGAVTGESPGLTQARKMGGAYEAGYKDAMEHMQQEMRAKGPGSGQAF